MSAIVTTPRRAQSTKKVNEVAKPQGGHTKGEFIVEKGVATRTLFVKAPVADSQPRRGALAAWFPQILHGLWFWVRQTLIDFTYTFIAGFMFGIY